MIEHHTFELNAGFECLLSVPWLSPETLLILTLHGYGSNPTDMLRLTAGAVGKQHVIAALQGPHQHYSAAPALDASAAYNWGIRQHWEQAVRLHHAFVMEAAAKLGSQFNLGPERTVLMGFSQPVGLNYRLIATHPQVCAGVIGICGGLPRDWEEPKYRNTGAAILHISRSEDEFYPLDAVTQFEGRLRRRASDVEFHLLPGSHRFPSKAAAIVQPWLARLFAGR